VSDYGWMLAVQTIYQLPALPLAIAGKNRPGTAFGGCEPFTTTAKAAI